MAVRNVVTRSAVGSVLALALLTSCAGSAEEGRGGMGVPQQFAGEEFPGGRHLVTLRVRLARDGCFLGRLQAGGDGSRRLVVWPRGTEQGESGAELRLPDGTVVRHGDVLTGVGLLMPTERLAHFGSDGFWDFAVGFCTPRAADVLVLDTAARASGHRT